MQNQTQHPKHRNVEESAAFTCEICMEPTSEKSQIGDPCSHPFCTNCMINYITAKLEDGAANIACPALACRRTLDPLGWGQLVGPPAFHRWCDALCEDAITLGCENDVALGRLAERMKWKRCPRCWRLVEKINGCSRVTCRCGMHFCYGCGNPFDRCSCLGPATTLANCLGVGMTFIMFLIGVCSGDFSSARQSP